MPKLTPAQLEAAAAKWNAHVEELLERAKLARRAKSVAPFEKQKLANRERLEAMRAERNGRR